MATWPVYSEDTEAGRQMGAATLEKMMGESRVRMEISNSRVDLLKPGWSVIAEMLCLSPMESVVLCSPTITSMVETERP